MTHINTTDVGRYLLSSLRLRSASRITAHEVWMSPMNASTMTMLDRVAARCGRYEVKRVPELAWEDGMESCKNIALAVIQVNSRSRAVLGRLQKRHPLLPIIAIADNATTAQEILSLYPSVPVVLQEYLEKTDRLKEFLRLFLGR